MASRMRRLLQIALAALLLSASTPFVAGPAYSASAIRVLVNDQPITTYDIQQRTKMLRLFTGGKAGEKEATDQLIDEQLMLQEAARRHVEVSDDAIDQEIADRARGAKMTAAQFSQALRQAGLDPETFRQFLHANMAWTRIVRARFRATVTVTDQDVNAALSAHSDTGSQQAAFEYMLQLIIFIVPPGSSNAVVNERLNAAKAFHDGFQGCDHSVEQAGSSPNIVIQPPVRKAEADLPAPMKAALAAAEVGSATKPEQTSEGFQIVGVCAKKAIAGESEAAVAVRQEILGERGQLLARRYLRDLRSDAVIEYR